MSFHPLPVSYFGIVLGLAGLGGAWRAAHRVWGLPIHVGETFMLLAGLIWLVFTALYIGKWLFARQAAIAELEHPVQCCFVGIVGVSTLLMGLVVLPYSVLAARFFLIVGGIYTIGFALWRTGVLWRGEREHGATTPVLYLPLVAGGFVTATLASALGYPDWGQLAFGAGLLSWLAIESVLLHRLYTGPVLAVAMRPTLGIQLAPPCVGAVAYLFVSGGAHDMIARGLIGYGLLQALLLVRMLPWIMEQPFAPSYWAFTFGATALATAPLLMMEHGETGAVAALAPFLFAAANLTVGIVAIGTLRLIARPWWPRAPTSSSLRASS